MGATFSLIVGVGAALGLAWTAWISPEREAGQRLNAGLLLLVLALIGARAGFVLVNVGYYGRHPLEIGAAWLGGLTWVGALAGALIALPLAARIFKQPVGALADALLPLALVLVTSLWLGCWQAGCVYGPLTDSGWWGAPSVDESGRLLSRLPLQPGAALVTLLLFFIIAWLRPWLKRPGQAAALAFAGMALVMLGVSLLRADPAQPVLGWRADGWAAVTFVLLALALVAWTFRKIVEPETGGSVPDLTPSPSPPLRKGKGRG